MIQAMKLVVDGEEFDLVMRKTSEVNLRCWYSCEVHDARGLLVRDVGDTELQAVARALDKLERYPYIGGPV